MKLTGLYWNKRNLVCDTQRPEKTHSCLLAQRFVNSVTGFDLYGWYEDFCAIPIEEIVLDIVKFYNVI